MKKWIQNLTRKRMILAATGGVSFLVFVILSCVSGSMSRKQDTQSMARRWSAEKNVSQISCFFSQSSGITEDIFIGFEHNLDNALVEASIVNESENESARLWADAYSATGSINIANNKTSMTVNAIGVGGDFFLFHPLELVSGSYFSGNDLMQDHILIDEEIAWQLFGSNDVAGQWVSVGNVPHMITGVVKRESGRLAEAAGLNASVAYVSYNSLSNYGMANDICHYEIVMPNPVKGYALKYVRENIGADENQVEVVENTNRYNLLSLFKVIAGFGTRSMNGKAIIYPYWENIARGYEDILALLLIFEFLFLMYPITLTLIAAVTAWKHRTWTARSVRLYLKDKWERMWEKVRENRKKQKSAKDPALPGESVRRKKEKKPKALKLPKEPKSLKNRRLQAYKKERGGANRADRRKEEYEEME